MIETKAGRVESIQALRALAALLVVFAHAQFIFRWLPHVSHSSFLEIRGVQCFGAIGVDLFFIVSGFAMAEAVSTKPERGAGRFLAERFARLMPFFWVMCLATIAARGAFGHVFPSHELLTSVTLIPFWEPLGLFETREFYSPVVAVGWSLAFEWAFYCVVAAALALRNKLPTLRTAFAITLACAVLGMVLNHGSALQDVFFNAMFFEFAAGMVLHRWYRAGHITRYAKFGPALIVLGVGGLIVSLIGTDGVIASGPKLFEGTDNVRVLSWGVPSLLFVIGWIMTFESWLARGGGGGALWAGAMYLGDASYSLYLFHMTYIRLVCDAIKSFPWHGEWLIAFLVITSAMISVVIYERVEKPLLKATRALMFGRKAPKTELGETEPRSVDKAVA